MLHLLAARFGAVLVDPGRLEPVLARDELEGDFAVDDVAEAPAREMGLA